MKEVLAAFFALRAAGQQLGLVTDWGGGTWGYLREPYPGIAWGRGLADLARSIVEGGPQRVTGQHAAHVVDILGAARRSMGERRRIELDSTFTPPPLMDWAAQPAGDLG